MTGLKLGQKRGGWGKTKRGAPVLVCHRKSTQIPENQVHCRSSVWKNYGMYDTSETMQNIVRKRKSWLPAIFPFPAIILKEASSPGNHFLDTSQHRFSFSFSLTHSFSKFRPLNFNKKTLKIGDCPAYM